MSVVDAQGDLKDLDDKGKVDISHDKDVVRKDAASTSNGIEATTLDEDPNPRSPKRRRLSVDKDNVEVDFEAAAARALAISLGIDQLQNEPAPTALQSLPNLSNNEKPPSRPASALSSHQRQLIEGLTTLDDLASQILATLAKMTHLEIGEMLFGPPSQRGQDYRALKAKFEDSKRSYLTNSPFASPQAIDLKQPDHVDVLRKMNMATFMASIFSGEIGLRIMDMNFLDVFVPEGGRLLKAQASIYLELKTQAFIAAKRTAPSMLEQVMLDLFPNDVEKHLTAKRPGAKNLAPSELDFLKRLASRRDILYADMRHKRLDNLELRYRWDDFSREVNSYLAKNYDYAGAGSKDKGDNTSPSPARAQLQQEQMESQFALDQPAVPALDSSTTTSEPGLDFNLDDFMAQAARAAEIALQGSGYSLTQPHDSKPSQPSILAPTPPPPLPIVAIETTKQLTPARTPTPVQQENRDELQPSQTEFQQYKPASANGTPATPGPEDGTDGVPHKSQTAPTQVLYERARLVTTNKSSPLSRKPNPPSHRRPWTNEEENALMTGLDQVKGPHWSQILAMYGPGGTINESLKDRNQVQLKDKARNLKLFFLKAGIEVPYYLQAVTGDLKTRAPAQAEKREAIERERVNADDEETLLQQDETMSNIAEDGGLGSQVVDEQEDIRESGHRPVLDINGENGPKDESNKDSEADALDMDAIIARAAASATQSLGDSW